MSAASSLEGAILGMGNPLLDISAHVPMELLEKCVAWGAHPPRAGMAWRAAPRAALVWLVVSRDAAVPVHRRRAAGTA